MARIRLHTVARGGSGPLHWLFWGFSGTSMLGNRQGKTEISFDLVERLSPSDLWDAVQDCPRSFV